MLGESVKELANIYMKYSIQINLYINMNIEII